MAELYDPLTYDNLMAGLAWRFRQRPQQRLATVEEVEGLVVYALFYAGGLNAYRVISGGENPIYVGKAVPPGSRKGTGVDASKPALRSRLREHTRSIDAAEDLEVAEFTYKHMAIEARCASLAS